jgi:hypothetical protein
MIVRLATGRSGLEVREYLRALRRAFARVEVRPDGSIVVSGPKHREVATARANPARRLYHGTTAEEPFTMLRGPGWVTQQQGSAEWFFGWGGAEGPKRILVYRVSGRPRLKRFKDARAISDFLEDRGARAGQGSHDLAEIVCREYDGWTIPGNYQDGGDDIMLCRPERWLKHVDTIWVDPEPEAWRGARANPGRRKRGRPCRAR